MAKEATSRFSHRKNIVSLIRDDDMSQWLRSQSLYQTINYFVSTVQDTLMAVFMECWAQHTSIFIFSEFKTSYESFKVKQRMSHSKNSTSCSSANVHLNWKIKVIFLCNRMKNVANHRSNDERISLPTPICTLYQVRLGPHTFHTLHAQRQ